MRQRLLTTVTLSLSLGVLLAAFAVPALAAEGETPVQRGVTARASATSVTFKGTASISGAVSNSDGTKVTEAQPIEVQYATRGGWLVQRKATTAANGTYKVMLPTWWYRAFTYRVVAPATVSGVAATSPSTKIAVKRDYTPRGSSSHWSWFNPKHSRWNPCVPITYKVNTSRASKGALDDVKGAFARISRATGMTFVYAGSTSQVATNFGGSKTSGADILIGWVKDSESSMINSSKTAGSAGMNSVVRGTDFDGDVLMAEKGMVAMNAGMKLAGGFGVSPKGGWIGTRGQVLMHELGHVLGLGHSNHSYQLMKSHTQRISARYGHGDLAGLDRIGLASGCVTAK